MVTVSVLPVGTVFAAGSVEPALAAWLWPETVAESDAPAVAAVAAAAPVEKC